MIRVTYRVFHEQVKFQEKNNPARMRHSVCLQPERVSDAGTRNLSRIFDGGDHHHFYGRDDYFTLP